MCSPEAAMAGLKVASAFAGYQDQKTKARTTQASNTIAKKNASRGLHDDYGYIDYQKGEARDEKVRETTRSKIAKLNEMAKQLNLNAGNPHAIMKDVGTEYETDYMDVAVAYDKDVISLQRKELEAFGAYERTINDLPVPYKPSKLGLAIQIAEAGTQYKIDTTD